MKMAWAVVLLVALGVGAALLFQRSGVHIGPASAEPAVETPRERAAAAAPLIAEAQDVVRRSLKDPYSAVFSAWAAVPIPTYGGEYQAACGFVNSKNGFGAYTGRQIHMLIVSPSGERKYCTMENTSVECVEEMTRLQAMRVCGGEMARLYGG